MGIIKKFRIKSFKKKNSILKFENISITYGSRKVLDKINFSIDEKTIHGLLGPNGAGKSTIYHLMTGLIKPKSGKIKIGEEDVTEFPEWLDGSVDSDGQPVAEGTEGSITRRLYYELEANKLMQTSPEGNVAAMNDAKIDVEGVNELTPELISAINGVIANGNPGEIAEMKQFLIQNEIPYADRFPELNN